MTDFRKQWNESCKAAGLVSIGKDTAAKLLAIVYVLGGEREEFTHNEKLKADLDYIQDVYGFKGGSTPDENVSKPFRFFLNEIQEYYDEHNSYPQWATKLMQENYGIKL